jgi:hypothetical protein
MNERQMLDVLRRFVNEKHSTDCINTSLTLLYTALVLRVSYFGYKSICEDYNSAEPEMFYLLPGPYFIWHIWVATSWQTSFVTSRCYSAARVDSRLSGLG